jgi:hypothetical protein
VLLAPPALWGSRARAAVASQRWLLPVPRTRTRYGSQCALRADSRAPAQLKTKGNGHFKAGEYAEAAVWYRKGIYYAGFDESQFNFELQDIHREQVDILFCSLARPRYRSRACARVRVRALHFCWPLSLGERSSGTAALKLSPLPPR